MNRSIGLRACVHWGVVVVMALAGSSQAAAQAQSINQRKTSAVALIGMSKGRYDGPFASEGISGVCGEIPKEASLTGTAVFVIEYPQLLADGGTIKSISFGSKQLVGGVTTSLVFTLSVQVAVKGGRPPLYVLNTELGSKNVGTATLTTKNRVTTLRVDGQNAMGETIGLTVTCA